MKPWLAVPFAFLTLALARAEPADDAIVDAIARKFADQAFANVPVTGDRVALFLVRVEGVLHTVVRERDGVVGAVDAGRQPEAPGAAPPGLDMLVHHSTARILPHVELHGDTTVSVVDAEGRPHPVEIEFEAEGEGHVEPIPEAVHWSPALELPVGPELEGLIALADRRFDLAAASLVVADDVPCAADLQAAAERLGMRGTDVTVRPGLAGEVAGDAVFLGHADPCSAEVAADLDRLAAAKTWAQAWAVAGAEVEGVTVGATTWVIPVVGEGRTATFTLAAPPPEPPPKPVEPPKAPAVVAPVPLDRGSSGGARIFAAIGGIVVVGIALWLASRDRSDA